jgi:hypothetical protein
LRSRAAVRRQSIADRLRTLLDERALELRAPVVEPLEVELHPHEEAAALAIGRVLGGGEDVRAALGEEPGDRRDDPVPVGARHEQPCNLRALAHRPKIPPPAERKGAGPKARPW